MIDALQSFFQAYPWGIYAVFFIAPFVQEDAAVLGAAAASSTGAGDPSLLFVSILSGLTASDIWKYWLGLAALTQDWARRWADKPSMRATQQKVINRLGASLMAVRFVPGTRIPFYIACGFFKAPFVKFTVFVFVSAAAYVVLAFLLFHTLGMVLGEQVKAWLPLVAIGMVVCLIAGLWLRSRVRAANDASPG